MDVYLLQEDWGYDGKQEIGVFSTLEAAQVDSGKHSPWEELIPKNQWIAYNKADPTNGIALVVHRFILDELHTHSPIQLEVPK